MNTYVPDDIKTARFTCCLLKRTLNSLKSSIGATFTCSLAHMEPRAFGTLSRCLAQIGALQRQ